MRGGTLPWLLFIMGTIYLAHGNQEALQAVTQGNNVFSTKLYDAIRKTTPGNLVVSPLSVSTAVAMLQAGARGDTAKDLRSSFHFPADAQLNSGYQSLIQELRNDPNTTFEMVNRIYPSEDFPLNPQFKNTLKNYFGAEPHQLNYAKNEEAARHINSFVSQSTKGKIQDLINPEDLDRTTKLVLINAIYFKGTWKYQFPKKDTAKMDFFPSETTSIKVDMMRLKAVLQHGYVPELNATAVYLPYEGGIWGMLVLLPDKRTSLSEMEDQLKSVSLDTILESLNKEEALLYLPKFKLESTIDLEQPLTEVGAGRIFDRPDFSGIPDTGSLGLYVSKAVQKAFIEVNEEGSEAAAATGIVLNGRIPSSSIIVDRPFYSTIVHAKGQVKPVFIQRVTNP